MAGETAGRGCFKRGCLGCLAVFLLLFVIVITLIIVGAIEAGRDPEPTRLNETQEVPRYPLPLGAPIEGEELPPIDFDALRQVDISEPGRVILDVGMTEFSVEPGPVGSSIRIEGDFDARRYRLEQQYEPYGRNGWTYRLKFRPRGLLGRVFLVDDPGNELRLILPRGVPISLEGLIGVGQSRIELGGLWIVETDLQIGIGEHRFVFSEPSPVPMRRFELDASIGELDVERLGHASPGEVRIAHSIGEATLDLRGRWTTDSVVTLACGIGECTVRAPAPDDANTRIRGVRVVLGESNSGETRRGDAEAREDLPTVEISAQGTLGEVNVR